MTQEPSPAPAPAPARVAIVPWGGVIEDFLAPIGLDRLDFAQAMSGGWLFGYAEALRRQGVASTILCFSGAVDRPERHENPATGVRTTILPAGRLYRLLRRWPGDADDPGRPRLRKALAPLQDLVRYADTPARAVARILDEEGIDALLVQEYEHPRFDRLVRLGARAGRPVWGSFQGAPPAASRLERALRRRSLRAAAGLIAASRPEAERLRRTYGLAGARVALVPNPLDLDLWHPEDRAAARARLGLPENALIAVCHGRIEMHRKGLDLLLAAWRRLAAGSGDRDLRLHLVGSGRDDALLAAEAARAPVPGLRWVRRYVTDRAEMRRELAAADLYVLPSRHEGSPVAPLEAMACGLPVVAADAPGVAEILAGGEASGGIVVPVGDAEALARAMGRLLDDAGLRAALAARARPRAAEWASLDAVGARLAALIFPGRAAGRAESPR